MTQEIFVYCAMFDIHYFKEEKGKDYPKGWEIAVADKLPVAEFNVQRMRPIVFDEMVMNPTNGRPALRVTSKEDFVKQSGLERFDGESSAARNWMVALKRASGHDPGHSVCFINIGHVPANGWGCHKTLSGITDLGRLANFWHELGHVFSLPHWGQSKVYPHKGAIHGISPQRPDVEDFPHVGPVWAYSLHRREFISPIVEKGSVRGRIGSWRGDPMQGGGYGDQPLDHMVRHFSDYSVNQMQRCMERKMLFWDEARKGFYRWNEETRAFSTRVASDGWNLPVDPRTDVFSVMVSASSVTPRVNFVYPVIGPYKAGLLNLFDATSAEDRKKAEAFGFSDTTCDLCVRITQGGSTTTYLLKAKLDPEADPLKNSSFLTTAVNLPAKDGTITRIDLLHTPDVMSKGVGDDVNVLYSRTFPEEK